jgi:single-strand DNA-binding protein
MIEATVVGNVGQKPELRETKTGKVMCRFSVASTYKSKQGEEGTTTWVSVLCFDEMAAEVAAKADKGQRVVVTGRLELEKYEKDGVERQSLTMLANEVGLSLRFPPRGAKPKNADPEAEWTSPF